LWWLLGGGGLAVVAAVVAIVVVAAVPSQDDPETPGSGDGTPTTEDLPPLVPAGALILGDPNAPVTVVVFGSFT
jgi:protein-disulfide isomerase